MSSQELLKVEVRGKEEVRGMQCETLAGFEGGEGGPRTRECVCLLKDGGDKELDSPLEPSEGSIALPAP